eukprot:1185493-Prorocentrum_minimum.AAC.1
MGDSSAQDGFSSVGGVRGWDYLDKVLHSITDSLLKGERLVRLAQDGRAYLRPALREPQQALQPAATRDTS